MNTLSYYVSFTITISLLTAHPTHVPNTQHTYTHTYKQKWWRRYLINLVSNNIISTEL